VPGLTRRNRQNKDKHLKRMTKGIGMHDLISFLGVLATAIMLVCVGHAAPANIAVIAAGLGALFAAWRNHGGHGDRGDDDSRIRLKGSFDACG
jgi:hypothetical protein